MSLNVQDGWEDDDDDDDWSFDDSVDGLNVENDMENVNVAATKEDANHLKNDNFSEHDEITFKDDRTQSVAEKLRAYLDELHSPFLLENLNNKFSNETNTEKAAQELLHYYSTRANLKSYTLETELPRMKYTVYPDNQSPPLTNVDEIQRRYLTSKQEDVKHDQQPSYSDILWRASNQSLLADAIATLTNLKPPLVRPDLLITAIAQHCHFTLHFDDSKENTLICICDLLLHIPNFDPHLATLKLQIIFSPSTATFTCQAINIDPNPLTQNEINKMAQGLVQDFLIPELSDEFDNGASMAQRENISTCHETFSLRNSLILSSTATATTNMVADTSKGLKSALHQMDSVVNIQSKWKIFKNVLPTLPTAELLNECNEYEENHQHQYPDPASNGNHHLGHGPPNVQENVFELYQPERSDQVRCQNSLKTNTNGSQNPTGMKFYRRENEPQSEQNYIPKFYNKDGISQENVANGNDEFQLYRREEPNPHSSDDFHLYRKENQYKLDQASSEADNEFQLYKRDDAQESQQQGKNEFQLYRKESRKAAPPPPPPPLPTQHPPPPPPPPPPPNSTSFSQLPPPPPPPQIPQLPQLNTIEIKDDNRDEGWSDDDLDLELSDGEDELESTNPKTPQEIKAPSIDINAADVIQTPILPSKPSSQIDINYSNRSSRSITSDGVLLEEEDFDSEEIVETRKRWVRPMLNTLF